jgi:uncharacterized protein (TIGR03067 family)
MRLLLLPMSLTVLLFASSQGSADDKEKAVEKELAMMQGLWGSIHADYWHNNGSESQVRPLQDMQKSHRIQGNRWIVLDEKGKATGVEKIITLDLSSTPKKIQLTTTRKGREGKPDQKITEYGIYELTKDGHLVHFGPADDKGGTKPAPEKFLQFGKPIKCLDGVAILYERMKE